MARAIDADVLIHKIGEIPLEYEHREAVSLFYKMIESMPTFTPPNELLTIEQLRKMGGQPYWHVGLRKDSPPPHWNILDPFYAKHIEDYKYGENWLAYRRPQEGEEKTHDERTENPGHERRGVGGHFPQS